MSGAFLLGLGPGDVGYARRWASRTTMTPFLRAGGGSQLHAWRGTSEGVLAGAGYVQC